MFKVYGCGTAQLAGKRPGDKIHLFGPLGNGFPLPEKDKVAIMAAGGIGLPPLYFLAKKSLLSGMMEIVFIAGARTKAEMLEERDLFDLGSNLIVCTDDGSEGERGTVVDILRRVLPEHERCAIYACGPNAMLKEVDRVLSERRLSGFFSLEALMPCGYGICSGCAVKVHPAPDRGPTDDDRDYHLKRVCIDGPVFNSGEVIWP